MYPLMLALAHKLGLDLTGVRAIQALLGALTCVLIYFLTRELAGEWPGRIAGAIAAIDPLSVYFTRLILSETLFLFLFVASWYFVVRTWKEVSGGASAMNWTASAMVADSWSTPTHAPWTCSGGMQVGAGCSTPF